MIICSPSMSIEGRISIGNFLLQTIVACKSWDTRTFLTHRIFGKYFTFFLAILTQTFHRLAFFTQTFRRVVCLWFLWLGRRLPKVPSNLRWTIVNKHWFFANIFSVVLSHICFKVFVPQRRRTKKFYLALLRGHVKEDRVDIDIPIGVEAERDVDCEF